MCLFLDNKTENDVKIPKIPEKTPIAILIKRKKLYSNNKSP